MLIELQPCDSGHLGHRDVGSALRGSGSAEARTRFASSAPVNPTVRLATWRRLTLLDSGRPRLLTWTFRISMRPCATANDRTA
eukprot:6096568-Pyramimonas_sp.AAC.1